MRAPLDLTDVQGSRRTRRGSLGQEEANIVGVWSEEPADRGAHDSFHPPLDSSFELVQAEVRFPDYRKSIADGPLRTPILGSRRDPRRAVFTFKYHREPPP